MKNTGSSFTRNSTPTGPTFKFRHAGSLYLGLSDEGWAESLKPIADFKLPGREVLDAKQAAEVGQIIRQEGVVGGVFDRDPIQVEARAAVRSLAARLRDQGVEIEEHRPATRLVVESGRVKGVETAHGPLIADRVVVSSAMWTNCFSRRTTSGCPTRRWARLVTTEPLGIPPTIPMLLVPDVAHAWLREEQGGLLWGGAYAGQHRYAFLGDELPNRLEQLPMDGLRNTQKIGLQLSSAIPLLARYHDFTYAQGAPCYTPDLLPLIGAVPGIEGLYALTGDSEAGITHGPGFGRALADQITGHEPFVDTNRYRIERFSDRVASVRDVVNIIGGLEGGVFR